jgi:hypothetical protein
MIVSLPDCRAFWFDNNRKYGFNFGCIVQLHSVQHHLDDFVRRSRQHGHFQTDEMHGKQLKVAFDEAECDCW